MKPSLRLVRRIAFMTDAARLLHMDRTAQNTRQEQIHDATIESTSDLSPTVKSYWLRTQADVTFKPGQWIDCFIPGTDVVGGFSICSAPHDLPRFQLAIKYANHPPAHWFHRDCSVGDQVQFRIGGDFYLDDTLHGNDLLLVAGGVGFNPLYSILQHAIHNQHSVERNIRLIYASRTEEELLFRKEVEQLASNNAHCFAARFLVSPQRITLSHLDDSLRSLRPGAKSFVCGPPPFIEAVSSWLQSELSVPEGDVLFEKWW